MKALVVAAVLSGSLLALPGTTAGQARVEDLQGRPVDPLELAGHAKATVFLFVSVECPISNRYAPEVRRLHERFEPQGVQFVLVYPNPAETVEAIERHLADYGYPARALRDPHHQLVKLAGATITPEAALYTRDGRLAYRGRVDDRYVSLGLERPAATKKDLEAALAATLAGRPVSEPTTPAVGCFIVDFVHIHDQ
jgi:hypothetical protein